MATTIYGLKTFKADGTTVILQPSSQGAVYGKAVTLDDAGTGATRSEPIPTRSTFYYYYLDFPEYSGRTILPMQLRPGLHEWNKGIGDGTGGTVSGVPFIRWFRNVYQPATYNITNSQFTYTTTVLYIFVK